MQARLTGFALVLLLASLVLAPTVLAQQAGFSAELNRALSGLQQAAQATAAAEQADSPEAARQQARRAIAALEPAQAALQEVLRRQPADDFVRSRAQAVLDQLDEALKDLREGIAGPDEALSGRINEARAQILEAIGELRPAIPSAAATPAPTTPAPAAPRATPAPAALAPPAQLPTAGEASNHLWTASLVLLGVSIITAGLRLRARAQR